MDIYKGVEPEKDVKDACKKGCLKLLFGLGLGVC